MVSVRFRGKVSGPSELMLHDEFDRLRKEFLREIGDEILEEAKRRAPVGATGKLKQSGRRKPADPNEWVLVTFEAPWAAYVHQGTKPHFPPPQALVDWVEAVLGVPPEEALRVAWAVCRTIARRGTKPQPFLRDATDRVLPTADAKFKEKTRDMMERLRIHGAPTTSYTAKRYMPRTDLAEE